MYHLNFEFDKKVNFEVCLNFHLGLVFLLQDCIYIPHSYTANTPSIDSEEQS